VVNFENTTVISSQYLLGISITVAYAGQSQLINVYLFKCLK